MEIHSSQDLKLNRKFSLIFLKMARGTILFDPQRITYYTLIQPMTVTNYPFLQSTEIRFGLRFNISPNIIRLSDLDFVLEVVFSQLLNDIFEQFNILSHYKLRIIF